MVPLPLASHSIAPRKHQLQGLVDDPQILSYYRMGINVQLPWSPTVDLIGLVVSSSSTTPSPNVFFPIVDSKRWFWRDLNVCLSPGETCRLRGLLVGELVPISVVGVTTSSTWGEDGGTYQGVTDKSGISYSCIGYSLGSLGNTSLGVKLVFIMAHESLCKLLANKSLSLLLYSLLPSFLEGSRFFAVMAEGFSTFFARYASRRRWFIIAFCSDDIDALRALSLSRLRSVGSTFSAN